MKGNKGFAGVQQRRNPSNKNYTFSNHKQDGYEAAEFPLEQENNEVLTSIANTYEQLKQENNFLLKENQMLKKQIMEESKDGSQETSTMTPTVITDDGNDSVMGSLTNDEDVNRYIKFLPKKLYDINHSVKHLIKFSTYMAEAVSDLKDKAKLTESLKLRVDVIESKLDKKLTNLRLEYEVGISKLQEKLDSINSQNSNPEFDSERSIGELKVERDYWKEQFMRLNQRFKDESSIDQIYSSNDGSSRMKAPDTIQNTIGSVLSNIKRGARLKEKPVKHDSTTTYGRRGEKR